MVQINIFCFEYAHCAKDCVLKMHYSLSEKFFVRRRAQRIRLWTAGHTSCATAWMHAARTHPSYRVMDITLIQMSDKGVLVAETLTTAQKLNEYKRVAFSYEMLLNTWAIVKLVVDSKDSFISLSTQRNSLERSTQGDVASVTYELQVGTMDEISWIVAKLSLADVLTKPDAPVRN